MRTSIVALLALTLAACGSEEGDSSESAAFSVDASQLTIHEGVQYRINYDVSAGGGVFSFEPENTINITPISGELVFEIAQDISDIELVSGSIVHSIDGNVAKVPVSVALMPQTRLSLNYTGEPIELSEYSESTANLELKVEPSSMADEVELSLGADAIGIGAFINGGRVGFRAGSIAESGAQTYNIELKLGEHTEIQAISFDLEAGSEPASIQLADDILTNRAFSNVRGDKSVLLYFYADLAYLAGSITQRARDEVQNSCYEQQANLVGSVVSSRQEVKSAGELVRSGEANFQSLEEAISEYQISIGALADSTMACINDFATTHFTSGVPSLPSNGLEYGATTLSVYAGNSDFGYFDGSTWIYSPQWEFMKDLGY